MTTELHEDVVLITPQLVMTDVANSVPVGGAPNRGPFFGSVELGRRLLLAARQGQTATVLDLMAKGAPFTTDWLGTSPLHVAAYGAHVETCAVLLRAGVSRDSRTKVERTPLHLAAHAGHASVAALLLERGALVDCRDMLQMTPLHWAAERGHAAAVAVLLRHSADPRALSKFHKTPLDLATAKGHHVILKLMEDALKEREAADSVDALKQADEQAMEIPAAEQQQALESIERLQETVKPVIKQHTGRSNQSKIEIEPVTNPEIEGSPAEGAAAEGNAGGTADGGAAALLRKHGITLLPHDSSSTVLNAIQSGRTVVLSDAGKLMLKESSAPAPAPSPSASKGMILTAAPVKAPPAGVKIFTLNNKLRATDKLPIKKLVNSQDMQVKLVSLPDTKLSSSTRISNVSMKAKTRRSIPGVIGNMGLVGNIGLVGNTGGGVRQPVKIIMQKANFDKMIGKSNNMENGMETGPVQITSTTDLGKMFQVSNTTPTIAPTGTVIGSTGGIIGNTGGVIGSMGGVIGSTGGAIGSTGGVVGNTGGVIGGTGGMAGTGFMCVPAEFLSSNSPAYLRSQLLAAHKTIHDLNQQLTVLKEQLAAYESL